MTTRLQAVYQKARYARSLLDAIAKADAPPVRRKIAQEFADDLQARIIDPWRKKIAQWLQERAEAPTADALEGLVNRHLQPDTEALQALLEAYHLRAANAGGQAALNKLRKYRTVAKAEPSPPPAAAEQIPQVVTPPQAGLDGGFSFNLRDPNLLAEMRNRGAKITGEVTQSMLTDLQGVLSREFYDGGKGPAALAADLDTIFPPTYANRAQTIARTETLFAQAKVQSEAFTRNGVESKQWLAIIDDKTRDDHADMHGETVPMDKPFVLPDGTEIDFPGDPGGDAEQVINCRCDFLPVFGEGYDLPEQPWLGGGADE